MTDATEPASTGSRFRTLLFSIAAAALLGGGGFAAATAGLVPRFWENSGGATQGDIAFLEIEPLVVNLRDGTEGRHLRFAASLEVERTHRSEVARLTPRVLDILHGYLRAVDPEELTGQGALVRLRAHLLRRIQLVTGEGRVRDLLITEFVIN